MKPYLIVEGIKVTDLQISHIDFSNEGLPVKVMTWDGENARYHTLDDSVKLDWENRYQPVIDRLQKKIDGIEENQVDLAVQYIENDVTTNETFDIREKYIRNGILLDGLYEAVGLIDEMVNGDEDE